LIRRSAVLPFKALCLATVVFASTALATPVFAAPKEKTLLSFDVTDGASPNHVVPVQGTDGNLYGTTETGGEHNYGTVFRISPDGALTTLHSFAGAEGAFPYAGLVLGADGNFYGTTYSGGELGEGAVFKVTPTGSVTRIFTFGGGTGATYPSAALIQGSDGKFYGTASGGGTGGSGTVFSITPSGALKTLHNFKGPDGGLPYAGLVQGTDGTLYGTTAYGGAHGDGTVFSVTTAGVFTTLYNFCSLSMCADGYEPYDGLIQGTDGKLYGTTSFGGAYDGGTVFSISTTGKLKTVFSFDIADGYDPHGGLLQGNDGTLYGTTVYGGVYNYGIAFSVTLDGTMTTLHTFSGSPTDGANPQAGLAQDTNGTFYGTTSAAGNNGINAGTVFSLSVGLGPFVEALPASGNVGATVKILGTNLTGATSVTFNGTAAKFNVVSSTLITAAVPADATTGALEVITPNGTLKSNAVFRVTN
jgi:uncharacterized repeat protein (TIGR03803 family)